MKTMIYAHHGEFTYSAVDQIRSFAQRDYQVIVSTTNPGAFNPKNFNRGNPMPEIVSRSNSGYDIGAWARALFERPELLDSDVLVLMNDSCINVQPMWNVIDEIDQMDYTVWGITDNIAGGRYHLQSYLRAFTRPALQLPLVRDFLCPDPFDVGKLSKLDIVNRFEVGFPLEDLRKHPEQRVKVMFEYKNIVSQRIIDALDDPNQYIYAWERLLALGYPFIKKSLFTQFKIMSRQDVDFILTMYDVDLRGYL